jgi:ubiquinone/menaquinone biosynthesis C-methylase UbiE
MPDIRKKAGRQLEVNGYMHKLIITDPITRQAVHRAISSMRLPEGSRGLDTGCGIGLQTVLLARAVGPAGHVTGLDIAPEFLVRAEQEVKSRGLSKQISFKAGDMNKLPFDDRTFDWIWSANCAGYPARKPLPLLQELCRVVKRSGKIGILVYASQLLLPGYPVLEARLNATSAGAAPFTVDMRPETHHTRLLGWFRKAGIVRCGVRTFVLDFHAPLRAEVKDALAALIEMRWGEPEDELSPEDWKRYKELTHPESPEYILNVPDYYAFIAFSLFYGRVS